MILKALTSTPNQSLLQNLRIDNGVRNGLHKSSDGPLVWMDATAQVAAARFGAGGVGGGVMHDAGRSTTQSPIYGAITQNRIRSNKGRASETRNPRATAMKLGECGAYRLRHHSSFIR